MPYWAVFRNRPTGKTMVMIIRKVHITTYEFKITSRRNTPSLVQSPHVESTRILIWDLFPVYDRFCRSTYIKPFYPLNSVLPYMGDSSSRVTHFNIWCHLGCECDIAPPRYMSPRPRPAAAVGMTHHSRWWCLNLRRRQASVGRRWRRRPLGSSLAGNRPR